MMSRPRPILSLLLLAAAALALWSAAPAPARAVTDEEILSLGATPVEGAETALGERDAAGPPSVAVALAKMAFALAAVLALMGLCVWLARRHLPLSRGGMRGGATIDVLATRTLGARRSLMLVRAQGRTLLLGVTPNAIQTLTEMDAEPGDWSDAAWRSGLDEAAAAGRAASRGAASMENRA
jgi:flagellar biosynthetic protein FliO